MLLRKTAVQSSLPSEKKAQDLVDVKMPVGYNHSGFIVGTASRVCYKAKTNL
jgi:hypothetical protein